MEKKRLGALIFTLMLAVTTLGICISITTATRAPGLDPRVYVEADATATAIAPAIYRQERYNEYVLPTEQAEQANQVTATIKQWYENTRAWNGFVLTCKKIAVGGLTIFSAIAQASGAGALFVAVACYIWERIKRALAYEPVQVIPERSLIFPNQGMLVDPRTGLVIPFSSPHQVSVEQGQLWIAAQTGSKLARYGFSWREERSPQMVEALRG